MEAPRWLEEESEIRQLLQRFLDKFNRRPASQWQRPPSIPVRLKDFPRLAKRDEGADRQWALIEHLASLGVFTIRLARRRDACEAKYEGAILVFEFDAEPWLRQWLDCPYMAPALQHWRAAVDRQAHHFPGGIELLRARAISVAGLSSAEVVQGFVQLGRYQYQRLTLRQLSALCFWGDSKFLDHRQPLLLSLYPDIAIRERPIVLNVFLPQTIEGVLLIENQDSYTSAATGSPASAGNKVLVYCSGFSGSAARIRQRAGVNIHYSGEFEQQQLFERWWFGSDWCGPGLSFWGDLDFSGMAILKALKQSFPAISAWQAGYEPMLSLINAGLGHRPEQCGKGDQADPQKTGCEYADNILLPALRDKGCFMDQEGVV